MSSNAGSNVGSLGDLQRAFQDYLLATSDTFQAAVRDTSKADRVTLLDVYRDGYALRLIEALTTDYPGLMAMAGPADFDHVARAYIAAHPSRHPSVRWYGRGMADFLANTEPYSRTPAAAEMARFEWALGEAFDSPDVTPITADALMALPQEAWETLSFTTLPSLRRLILAFEAPQAWQRREEVEPGDLRGRARARTAHLGDLAARPRVQLPLPRRRRSGDARRAGRGPALPRAVRSRGAVHRRRAGAGPRRRPVTGHGRGRHDRGVPLLTAGVARRQPL